MQDDSAVTDGAGNPQPNKGEGRLDGWVEIAAFLSRGLRTVQRWEKEAALPVHRLFKQRRSLVYAYRRELTQWATWREEPPALVLNLTSEPQPQGDFSGRRDVLMGWKEVAASLDRSVSTVQRWERDVGLPVRRLKSKGRGIPYVLRSEIATWLQESGIAARAPRENDMAVAPPPILQAFINGYGANLVVLDAHGTVVAVNQAWREFVAARGHREADLGLGRNYLEFCRSVPWGGMEGASVAAAGLLEMFNDARREHHVKYLCSEGKKQRWFSLHITRFTFRGSVFLIMEHSDITDLLQM